MSDKKKSGIWSPGGIVALSVVGVIGLAFVVAVIVSMITSGGASKTSVRDTAQEAWTKCKLAVMDQLKAPSTADFPMFDPSYVDDVAAPQYRVRSYVDAQNSFGAMVRTDFICIVTQTSSSWQVDDVTILG